MTHAVGVGVVYPSRARCGSVHRPPPGSHSASTLDVLSEPAHTGFILPHGYIPWVPPGLRPRGFLRSGGQSSTARSSLSTASTCTARSAMWIEVMAIHCAGSTSWRYARPISTPCLASRLGVCDVLLGAGSSSRRPSSGPEGSPSRLPGDAPRFWGRGASRAIQGQDPHVPPLWPPLRALPGEGDRRGVGRSSGGGRVAGLVRHRRTRQRRQRPRAGDRRGEEASAVQAGRGRTTLRALECGARARSDVVVLDQTVRVRAASVRCRRTR